MHRFGVIAVHKTVSVAGRSSSRCYLDLDEAIEEIMQDSDSRDDFDPEDTEICEVDSDFDPRDTDTSIFHLHRKC